MCERARVCAAAASSLRPLRFSPVSVLIFVRSIPMISPSMKTGPRDLVLVHRVAPSCYRPKSRRLSHQVPPPLTAAPPVTLPSSHLRFASPSAPPADKCKYLLVLLVEGCSLLLLDAARCVGMLIWEPGCFIKPLPLVPSSPSTSQVSPSAFPFPGLLLRPRYGHHLSHIKPIYPHQSTLAVARQTVSWIIRPRLLPSDLPPFMTF